MSRNGRWLESVAKFSTKYTLAPRSPNVVVQRTAPFEGGLLESSFSANFREARRICEDFSVELDELTRKCQEETERRIVDGQKRHKQIDRCIIDLKRVLETSDRRIYPIGSAVNGLNSKISDLDMVMFPSCSHDKLDDFRLKFHNSEVYRTNFMNALIKLLQTKKLIHRAEVLGRATVPILKFSLHGVPIDIQFGNTEPILSSLYLRSCVETDPRVAQLIDWVKRLFSTSGLKCSQTAFSSFEISLLVLHFIKYLQPSFLPSASDLDDYKGGNNWILAADNLLSQDPIQLSTTLEDCPYSTGELMIYLVEYYAQLDMTKFAIDCEGKVFERSQRQDNKTSIYLLNSFHGQTNCCNVINSIYLLNSLFCQLSQNIHSGNLKVLHC